MIKRYLKIDIPWEIGGNDLKVHTERGRGGVSIFGHALP